MRTIYWLFAVSVALFVSGIGFVIASARTSRDAAPLVDAPATVAVATVKQIMNGITSPSAAVVYRSVGTIVSAEGVQEIAPRTDDEWMNVANNAAALVESANLLLMGGRAVDKGDWVTQAKALRETAQMALKAAEAKDRDAIMDAGAKINETCDACHQKYQRQ